MIAKRLLVGAVAAACLTSGGLVQAADDLTVVSWGGAYTRSQVKAYHEPWEKMTGAKINSRTSRRCIK